jgi:hypothetical protein
VSFEKKKDLLLAFANHMSLSRKPVPGPFKQDPFAYDSH